jgi:hypothetical protein
MTFAFANWVFCSPPPKTISLVPPKLEYSVLKYFITFLYVISFVGLFNHHIFIEKKKGFRREGKEGKDQREVWRRRKVPWYFHRF